MKILDYWPILNIYINAKHAIKLIKGYLMIKTLLNNSKQSLKILFIRISHQLTSNGFKCNINLITLIFKPFVRSLKELIYSSIRNNIL
jgi:hypothetical protein